MLVLASVAVMLAMAALCTDACCHGHMKAGGRSMQSSAATVSTPLGDLSLSRVRPTEKKVGELTEDEHPLVSLRAV
jgi:hypothetical protein